MSWETIDGDVVRDWMVSMMEAGRTATTVNRRLSALRTFYRYLLKRDWIKADPVRNIQGPKKKKPLPVFLKESEMDRLLDGEFFDSDFLGKRDKPVSYTHLDVYKRQVLFPFLLIANKSGLSQR